MKKKLLSGLLALMMSTSVLVGCGSSGSDSEVIKIGGIGPLTGSASTYGNSAKEGADLFIKEINDAGGINGKKIELIFEDDGATPDGAMQAFNKLVDKDEVSAILGGVTSGATLAIAKNSTERQIPMITPTGTEPSITNEGGEFMFRGCFIDSFQGDILAKYTTDNLNKKTAAVLYNAGSDYSIGIAKAYKETLEKNGGTVVEYLSYNDGDTDFKAQLTKIKGSNPDVIVLPDYYNVVGLIAKQARDISITSQFLGGDGWESEELVEIGGEAVNGALYINHYYSGDTSEIVKNFVESYKKEYNKEPDAFAALAYDSARVLVEAIKNADSTDGTAIKDELAKIELESVTGKISFNEERSAIKGAAVIKLEGENKILADKLNP
ncbi:ABC transporter substrate-binding protein [Clostridium sp. AL.422]|uniref:ABC transporter substrate-binding protein n=1 Tax=Clostridium TaxID=1485 RepID=UPI00293DF368|nr:MULTISPECIES: ABC transporter substrate-binding protein [unclassified Clostridium]MDV4150989.1 ABC transporter substrate-binding protein [Clostridium sp. AL.422]